MHVVTADTVPNSTSANIAFLEAAAEVLGQEAGI